MRIAAMPIILALAGCVEPAPPSPAQAKLQSACDGGNLASCETILAKEQADQEAYRASMREMAKPWPTQQTYQSVQPYSNFQVGGAQTMICPYSGRIIPMGGAC